MPRQQDEPPQPARRTISRRDLLKRGGLAVSVAMIGPSLLGACGSDTQDGGTGGTLRIAAPATPTGFDREFNVTTGDLEQSSNLFSPLLSWERRLASGIPQEYDAYEQDAARLAPNVIESWELSNDGKTITLRMREGLVSNHGNELTADDAVWSLERVVPLDGANSFLFFESGYGDPKTSEIKKVDDYSFSITAECPSAMLERSQASVWQFIYDATEARRHATDEDPWASEWLKSNPCGYGPFFIDKFTPGEQVVYRANEKYHAGRPKVDQVIYRQVSKSSTRTALVAQGEVDVATNLRPDELARLENTSGVRVLYFPGNYLTYLVPNQRSVEAFRDARVRQALAYATPQAEIGESIYNGRGQRMDSVIPSTYPTYDPQFFSYGYDPEKAKQLLREAGHGQGLEFRAMYTDAIPELEDLGVVLRTAYERVGVRMELERQPAAVYFDSLYGPNKNYEAALSRELAVVPDPVHATYQFFYSDSPINTVGVDDPELDELLLRSLCEPAPSRGPIFSDIQQTVMDAALWIPVWAPGNQVAIRENVQGYTWQFNNGFTWHLVSVT